MSQRQKAGNTISPDMSEQEDMRLGGIERTAVSADRHQEAWKQTLADAEAIANAREADGWDTVVIHAIDTAPEAPDVGDTTRYGIVHVIPDNMAANLRQRTDELSFQEYDAYRATVDGRLFLVTELLAPADDFALYVAGTFEIRHAQALYETAAETETLYTHLQTLDETPVASFVHDEYQKLVPSAFRQA